MLSTIRYTVWIANSPHSSYRRAQRLSVINCRKQAKGLGAASFQLVKRDTENTALTEPVDVELREGQWIKVVDAALAGGIDNEGPTGIFWIGQITSIPTEAYAGSYNAEGQVNALEIGHFLDTQRLKGFMDSSSRVLSSPPPFNPVINGRLVGNYELKNSSDHRFRISGFDYVNVSSIANGATWSNSGEKAWNRQKIIKLLCSLSSTITISPSFPTKPSSSDVHDYFASHEMRSYKAHDDSSLIDALDELIEAPYTWFFDYTVSLSSVELVIKSTAVDDVGTISRGDVYEVELDRAVIKKFDVIGVEDSKDQIVYTGDNIIACGSMSTFATPASGGTLVKAWADNQETAYRNADFGGAKQNQVYRKQYLNGVYAKFAFNAAAADASAGQYLQVTDLPGDDAIETRKAFCPAFTFVDSGTGEMLPAPTVNKTTAHSTPNPPNMKICDTIPIADRRTLIGDVAADENDNEDYLKPSIWYMTYFPETDVHMWIEPTNPALGQDQGKIKFWNKNGNGIFLDLPYNEVLAWDEPELGRLPGGSLVTLPSIGWDSSSAESDRNPETEEYYGKGNWQRLVATVAIECDQKLGVSLTKASTITGGFGVQNIAYFDDDTLQCWFVHAGTVSGSYQNEDGDGVLARFDQDTFTRNDFPILYNRAKEAAAWLFRDRKSLSLEFSIGAPATSANEWTEIGNIVGTVTDYGPSNTMYERTFNTPVMSIELMLMDDEPRMVVQTEIPDVPRFKRYLPGSSNKMARRMNPTANDPVNKETQRMIEMPKYPEIGIKSFGGDGGGTATAETILVFGTIAGGNSQPVISGGDVVYPAKLPFIFPYSYTADTSSVDDVDDYTLPRTWRHTDNFPKAYPPGFGKLRLRYGSAEFAGKSYDADNTAFGSTERGLAGAPEVVRVVMQDDTDFAIFMTEAVSAASFAPSAYPITIHNAAVSAAPLTLDLTTPYVGMTAANAPKYRFSRAITDDDIITLDIGTGLVWDYDTPSPSNNATAAGVEVHFPGDRDCYLDVFNGSYLATAEPGTWWEVQTDNYIDLPDTQDPAGSIRFYNIIPRQGSGTATHYHLDESTTSSGGGAIGNAPTTPSEVIRYNQSQIIKPGSV